MTRLSLLAGSGVLWMGLSGCALFSPAPDPIPWTGQIETFAPGVEVSASPIAVTEETDGGTALTESGLPAGLVGPNPEVADESLLDKAVALVPGLEIPTTEAVPVQEVDTAEQPSVAEQDATGWVWNDRSRRWELTARQVPKAEEWLFENEALLFRVSAPNELNLYEGSSHATVVKIIQLDNPKAFNALRQDPFGMADMLTQRFIDPSFIAEKRLFMLPDDSLTISMDREEGTRYVGILAGYYALDEYKQVSRLIQIPAVAESLETGTLSKLWPLSKDETLQRPARLKLWVELGIETIDEVAIQVN